MVSQVQLGPLEATTLAGGDVNGIQQWLSSHGYTMRPEVVAKLDPYLQQGWAFVAMRLTGSVPLNGPLAPVKLVFGSDQLVYPMRMAAAARATQRVVIYALGKHQMQRIDRDTTRQVVNVEYAGSIAGRSHDETLTELAANGAFLTRISVQISDPGAITSDFAFGPAPNDNPSAGAQQDKNGDHTVAVVVTVVVATVVLALAAIVVTLRRRRNSTAS